MKTAWFRWPATLLAGVLAVHYLGLAATAAPQQRSDRPADKTSTPPQLDKGQVDQHLYDHLRDVINQGADLYNNGDPNACYNLFRSALVAAWYMLDHHPEMRRDINAALTRADGQFAVTERAHTLRAALDATRDGLRTSLGKGPAAPGTNRPAESASTRPAVPAQTTLWDRLGGEANVRKVVDDFAAIAGSDPKVDFTRGGKYPLTPDKLTLFKQEMVDFISENTGGPRKYTGLSMKTAHRGMAITDAQFDASVADLRKALEKNNAKPADIDALLRVVEGTRKQIVQATAGEGKPGDKKPASGPPGLDTKPNPGKPADSGAEEKKPVGKPATEAKPEDKKPAAPKPEDTKPPEGKQDTGPQLGERPSANEDSTRSTDKVDIKGTLTYKGKPLPEVVVRFVPQDKRAVTRNALTTKDGAFAIKDVPAGEYTVTVQDPGKSTIPEEYSDPQKSKLKYKVTKDDKLFIIDVK